MISHKIIFFILFFACTLAVEWGKLNKVPQVVVNQTPTEDYNTKEASKFVTNIEQLKQKTTNDSGPRVEAVINPNINQTTNLVNEFFPTEDMPSTVHQLRTFNFESYDQTKQKPVNHAVQPGMKMLLSYTAIKNIIKCYIPKVLKSVLATPMDISFSVNNITLKKIWIHMEEFLMDEINLGTNVSENKIILSFPPLILKLIIDTDINLGFNVNGFVSADLNIENLIISLRFYEDYTKDFFKPRIDLNLEEFNVADSVLNLQGTFSGMPDYLINSILYLYQTTIIDNLQKYIKQAFVLKSSQVLNFLIDKKYPSNVRTSGDNIRFSSLMTQKPLVTSAGLVLFIAGDFFDTNEISEEEFVPTPSANTLMEPSLKDSNNIQVLLSETFIRKTLNTYLSNKVSPMNLNSMNFYTIDITNATILVNKDGISLNDTNLNMYINEPVKDNDGNLNLPDKIKKISLSVMANDINLTNGTFKINISQLKLFSLETEGCSSFLQPILNYGSHMMVKLFKNGIYNFPIPTLENGLSLSSIKIDYGTQYIILNSSINYAELILYVFI